MEVNVCIDFQTYNTNPRISFSSYLNEIETNKSSNLKDFIIQPNDIDFDFNIPEISVNELSPADELFSDGRIKPMPFFTPTEQRRPLSLSEIDETKILMEQSPKRDPMPELASKRTPLKFNYDSTHKKSSPFCSLSFLWRSKPIGSLSNGKQRQEKPARKILMNKEYVNGVRVNPVLNLPMVPKSSKKKLSFWSFCICL